MPPATGSRISFNTSSCLLIRQGGGLLLGRIRRRRTIHLAQMFNDVRRIGVPILCSAFSVFNVARG
jgi:hypothetical protein